MRRSLAIRALAAAWLVAGPASAGDLGGVVSLGVEGARLADLGPTVVFLETVDAGASSPAKRRQIEIHQKNARFEPSFLVLTVGEPLRMANDDTIFHNVFSFSRPNDFDLGVYPSGEIRTVRFEHAGLVRIYCSIHESMSGAVLVVPTPWFARVSADGEYRIRGVPAGRYRLTAWNERLPSASRIVEVDDSGDLRNDVVLAAREP